nr:hypothetical protein [Microvirga sp. VF16]
MSNLGLPVPPGFTITTEVCTFHQDYETGSLVALAIRQSRCCRAPAWSS